jgi:alpha-L-fucosidase 2
LIDCGIRAPTLKLQRQRAEAIKFILKKHLHNRIKMVRSILILLLGIIFFLPSSAQDKQKKLKLWYRQPALQWDHAMPIGNGRLGAMVFGGVQSEKIVLNEESIWSHDGEYTDSKGAYKYVKEIRQLLFDGKYKEAEKLAAEKVMGDRLPSGTNTYQELGELTVDLMDHSDPQDYYRELDLETAITTVKYKVEKTEFTRESFSSAVDQAIFWRIGANDSGKINAKISLQRDGFNHDIQVVDNEIVIRGIAGKEKGVGYCGRVKVIPVNGKISHGKKSITVSSADTLLLVIRIFPDR